MHFATGSPAVYPLVSNQSDSDERAIKVSASPVGNCLVVLSQKNLHFWTCTNDIIRLGILPIPGTSNDDDPAIHLLWHPRGEYLVIATLQRRLIFFEVSITIKNSELLAPTYHEYSLKVGSIASQVRFTGEERLEIGIVTSLIAGGSNCLFACTTAGVVCVIGWFQQKLLYTWSCHSLSKGNHFFDRINEEGVVNDDSNIRVVRGEVLNGTIIDIFHSSLLKLTSILLSNGYVILARSNVGSDFTKDNITFKGKILPASSASHVTLNSKHMLIVMATHAGDAVCKRIDEELSISFFWNGLKCLKGVRRIGAISDLKWNLDEELLCMGFYHLGFVVVHYSGVCIYSSIFYNNTPSSVVDGCVSLSWSSHFHRLFIIEPRGNNLTSFGFSQIISNNSADIKGCFTPIFAFDNEVLRLAGNSSTKGGINFSDLIKIPSHYTSENYSLKYGAISSDGTAMILAGKNGFILFDRVSRRWRTLRDKNQERDIICVAQPIWLNSIAVVIPVRMICTRTYALRVYAHRYLDTSSLLIHIPLDRLPLHICECHYEGSEFFLVMIDISNTLLLWHCEIFSKEISVIKNIDISVKLIKSIKLPNEFLNPIQITAIHPTQLSSYRKSRRTSLIQQNGNDISLPNILFILRGSHALVSINFEIIKSDISDILFSINTLCPNGVYHIWIDNSTPIDGSIVLLFCDKGISIFHLFMISEGVNLLLNYYDYSVGEFDADSLPIGISTFDGYLLTASSINEVLSPIGDFLPIVSLRITVKSILYNYRVLAAMTRLGIANIETINGITTPGTIVPFIPPVWSDKLFYWLERMRCNGTFVLNTDYYLHTLIEETPPAGIEQLDRRFAVQSTISLLRRYSEFYSVIVNCVRKMDLSRWQLVLDILGSPVEFFRECVENNRFEEAAHLLRVIMMDGNISDDKTSVESLGNAMKCAAQLLIFALSQRNIQLIHDLIRFTALLHNELIIPTEKGNELENSGVWNRLWSAVGFQQDLSKVSLIETEPLLFIELDDLLNSSSFTEKNRRRYAIEFLFRNYQDVRKTVENVATELLFSGHLILLRDIMQELCLSLLHFIKVKTCKIMNELNITISPKNETIIQNKEEIKNNKDSLDYFNYLPDIFDGIHNELGIPRSIRCITSNLQNIISSSIIENRNCTEITKWTCAQIYLYSTSGILEILINLRDLYSMWDECVLAINIILMNDTDVKEQLKDNPELVDALQNLLSYPKNKGYELFIEYCLK